MSIVEYCDVISQQLTDPLDDATITATALEAEKHLENAEAIADTLETSLMSTDGDHRLALWKLLDKMAKLHATMAEVLRPRMIRLCTNAHPEVGSSQYSAFRDIVDRMGMVFGEEVACVVQLKLGGAAKQQGTNDPSLRQDGAPTVSSRTSAALIVQSDAMRAVGGFHAQRANNARPDEIKHTLQVKTRDSLMAMRVAGQYAPAVPVEMTLPALQADADCPRGLHAGSTRGTCRRVFGGATKKVA